MHRPLATLRLVLVCSVFLAPFVHAQTAVRASTHQSVSPAEQDAASLLRRSRLAAERLDYSGTFVYQQGSQIRTSRITHVLDGRTEREKLELLDGSPREYIRTNDEIVSYLPESRTLLIEKRVIHDVFPAVLGTDPEQLATHYQIRRGGAGRIAGFDADAILLQPKDRLRYGYVLWSERGSGLLLRMQTIGENGDVVEQIMFTQLEIGGIDRSRTRPAVGNTSGWRTENVVQPAPDLADWVVTGVPNGFRRVREIRRLVTDSGKRDGSSNGPLQRQVGQIVFSDGLASISVFIEPASQSRTEGSARQGAMNIVGKRQGDFWLTIVGEVPSEAIQRVANSIGFKPSK